MESIRPCFFTVGDPNHFLTRKMKIKLWSVTLIRELQTLIGVRPRLLMDTSRQLSRSREICALEVRFLPS